MQFGLIPTKQQQSNTYILEELLLKRATVDINNFNYKIVYQDEDYSFILKADAETKFDLFINGTKLDEEKYKHHYDEGYNVSLKNIFSLIFGITDICVVIHKDDENEYYYTPFLNVATSTSKDCIEINKRKEESVNSMLDYIYLEDHYLLQNQKDKLTFEKKLSNGSCNNLEVEIDLLKIISLSLKQNSAKFFKIPKTKPQSINQIGDFEKLRQISNSTIKYIASNPQQLYQTSNIDGININGKGYLPRKTLLKATVESKDVLENRSIVSFINTIVEYLKLRLIELEKQLDINFIINTRPKENYTLSYSTIKKYFNLTFKKHYDNLKSLNTDFKKIQYLYKKKLLSIDVKLSRVPQPTTAFLEIFHYRTVYENMVKWFSFVKPDIPNKIDVLHFMTADKIYEYYSLLKLGDMFKNVGLEKVSSKFYKYDIKNYEVYSDESALNTFSFKSDSIGKVILYYQPVIYSNNNIKRNEISLFRTSYSRRYPYYTPDFLIKVIKNKKSENEQDEKEIKYAILDSKWSTKKTLQDNDTLKDCLFKYMTCVKDEISFKSVDFMWLLSGQDTVKNSKNGNEELEIYDNTAYVLNKSSISKSSKDKSLYYSVGYVPLTPKSGDKQFSDILKYLLNS